MRKQRSLLGRAVAVHPAIAGGESSTVLEAEAPGSGAEEVLQAPSITKLPPHASHSSAKAAPSGPRTPWKQGAGGRAGAPTGCQLHALRAPDCLQHAIRTLCFISHWCRAPLHRHGGQKGEGGQAQALGLNSRLRPWPCYCWAWVPPIGGHNNSLGKTEVVTLLLQQRSGLKTSGCVIKSRFFQLYCLV